MSRVRPDIPRAKADGLELDLEAVCAAGPTALEPDDHYRLKTYGVCAQRQDGLFMIRLRATAGTLDAEQVARLAEAADRYAGGWVHLTTRQNVELHSVRLEDVPALYDVLRPAGLVGASACGHTIRNVMACPEAATSPEEPFDVTADARHLADLLLARSSALNIALPGRLNIVLGGCRTCGLEALTNDIGLVATVRDGEPGYQLWAGGSLGTAPKLSVLLRPFLNRHEVWPAVWALISWFCENGSTETVARGRLKHVIEDRGEAGLRTSFTKRFLALMAEEQPPPPPIEIAPDHSLESALAAAPGLGWRAGIQPEREAGRASITVRVPLGDLLVSDLVAVAALSPTGGVVITKDQNLLLRGVPTDGVQRVVGGLADLGLGPDGARGAVDVRACPGLAFCPLAITDSQPLALRIERALSGRPDLPRDLTIAVSGCPNSCAKQQAADVGLAGAKVKVNGKIGMGYQLFLGADLPAGQVGEPVLRLLDGEVPAAITSVAEVWDALRRPGETLGQTSRRIGLDVMAGAVIRRLREVAPPGAEPAAAPELVATEGAA